MTKGEIIYRTGFAIFYFILLMLNIKGAIQQAQWIAFLQGIAVVCCITGLAGHIVKLVKGKVKVD